jgi:hypothetical protein
LGSLASDVLLYDRLILPVPEDDPERDRWLKKQWDPGDIALRVVQSAGRIIPVPWTAELRARWKTRKDELSALGDEVAYGLTGIIYASYPPAWNEIAASLAPADVPRRKPAILAGFQSAEEAKAELAMAPATVTEGPKPEAAPALPGARPVDQVIALHVRRIVHEPAIAAPEEAFLTAIQLTENDRFQRARRSLFDFEDDLYVDGWEPKDVEERLHGLEEEYRDAVKAEVRRTQTRWIATVLPKAAGWGIGALGHPALKKPVSKSLEFVSARLPVIRSAMQPSKDLDTHPGAALEMIRAAYRHKEPEHTDEKPRAGDAFPGP